MNIWLIFGGEEWRAILREILKNYQITTKQNRVNSINILTIFFRLQNLFQLFSVGPDSNKSICPQSSWADLQIALTKFKGHEEMVLQQ